MTTDRVPVVAVVGRPNVGKSTLFNRIVGGQAAIVEDRPGITRDRKELDAEWLGVPFRVIDTGGWLPRGDPSHDLDAKVSRQVETAVRHADVVMFVVDGSVGMTDDDEAIADWLRRGVHEVIVVANKADNDRREDERWEFLALGLGEPYPVSALHGRRAGDLLDVVVDRLPAAADDAGPDEMTAVDEHEPWTPETPRPRSPSSAGPTWARARSSIGWSARTAPSCTTCPARRGDLIDTLVETEDGPIVFVDTAGMRRRARIDDAAEYYSLVRALRAIDDADIALLLVDATEGVTGQDQRLAERVEAAGCPIVVVLNKWDLLADPDDRASVLAELARRLAFIGDAPVLRVSALTGKGVHRLRPVLQDAIEQYHRRVPTRDVNRVLADAQQRHPAGGGAKVLFAVQGATDPPTFTLFTNRTLPQPYLRYLERSIREAFDFGSTPLKLRVRRRTG